MAWLARLTHRAKDDRGAALVMAVVWLPILVLMAGFAIGVANWFVHKRHLQMQADAAALAGAALYSFPNCQNDPIINTAKSYSGVPGGSFPNPANKQISPSTNVTQTFNDGADDPCNPAKEYLKVHLEDNDPGLFFLGNLGIIPKIKAEAIVSVFQESVGNLGLPLAIAAAQPRTAHAWVIDETQDQVLGETDLTCTPLPAPQTGCVIQSDGSTTFASTPGALSALFDNSRKGHKIGLRVALSDSTQPPTSCSGTGVSCYDQLNFFQAWSNQPAVAKPGDNPQPRSVTLTSPDCAASGNGYFETPPGTGSCHVIVHANVDFGTGTTDPTQPSSVGATLKAVMNGQTVTMTYSSGSWTSGTIDIGTNTGALPVDLKWDENGNGCISGNKTVKCNGKGTLSDVERNFAAGPNPADSANPGGPIRAISVTDPNHTGDPHSQQTCTSGPTCTATFTVQISVAGLTKDNTLKTLRFPVQGNVGGGSLQCDPGVNLETMIEKGCQTFYQVNDGSGCAVPTDPLSCIPRPTTGAKAGQIRQGLNARLTPNGVSDCTGNALNRWTSTNGNPPDGDPRIVKLFIAPVGSFTTNSIPGPVPVDGYASFYIAGWDGDPCSGDPPAPAEGIVGYFMTKVEDNGAGGGTKPCNPDSVLTCVAVLTK